MLSRCAICQKPLGEQTVEGWLKVQLPGIKKRYIYVDKYVCECQYQNLIEREEQCTTKTKSGLSAKTQF